MKTKKVVKKPTKKVGENKKVEKKAVAKPIKKEKVAPKKEVKIIKEKTIKKISLGFVNGDKIEFSSDNAIVIFSEVTENMYLDNGSITSDYVAEKVQMFLPKKINKKINTNYGTMEIFDRIQRRNDIVYVSLFDAKGLNRKVLVRWEENATDVNSIQRSDLTPKGLKVTIK